MVCVVCRGDTGDWYVWNLFNKVPYTGRKSSEGQKETVRSGKAGQGSNPAVSLAQGARGAAMLSLGR